MSNKWNKSDTICILCAKDLFFLKIMETRVYVNDSDLFSVIIIIITFILPGKSIENKLSFAMTTCARGHRTGRHNIDFFSNPHKRKRSNHLDQKSTRLCQKVLDTVA